MSDTISRQAAIDAYGDWYVEEGTEEGFIGTVKQLLEGLPSAEPEIIRCKDCKHWTNNIGDPVLRDNYCNEKTHGFYYRCSGDDYCSFAERINDGRFNQQTGGD